jgi:hypothetical protein
MTYPDLESVHQSSVPKKKNTSYCKNSIIPLKKPGDISEDPLTELLRSGARQLIADAVEVELQELLSQVVFISAIHSVITT